MVVRNNIFCGNFFTVNHYILNQHVSDAMFGILTKKFDLLLKWTTRIVRSNILENHIFNTPSLGIGSPNSGIDPQRCEFDRLLNADVLETNILYQSRIGMVNP